MAIVKSINVSGRVGNVIFVKRYGCWYARSAPRRVRQAPASKLHSRNFAVAATVGMRLRHQLTSGIPYPRSKNMQNRLAGAIVKWLDGGDPSSLPAAQQLPYLSGFSFNEAGSSLAGWTACLQTTQPVKNELAILIPALVPVQVFKAPRGTAKIRCQITVAYCNLSKPVAASQTICAGVVLPYTGDIVAAQTVVLALPATAGALLLTVVSLSFLDRVGQQFDKAAWLPSVVLDARYCSS